MITSDQVASALLLGAAAIQAAHHHVLISRTKHTPTSERVLLAED